MKRFLTGLLVTALLSTSTTVIPSSAAIKEGGKCAKAGKVSFLGNQRFVCTSAKKKLSWRLSKPPAAKPLVLPESWPLDKPVKLQDLELIADASVRKYVADANKLPDIKIFTGPTTSRNAATNYLKHLDNAAKSWSKDWLPEVVHVAIGGPADYSWITPLWLQYGLNGGGFDNSRDTWTRCGGGSAIFDKVPFFWGCYDSRMGDHIGYWKFGPHEYTHLVQYGIISHKHGVKGSNFPSLFSEGSADFYGVTFASSREQVSSNWATYWMAGYFSQEVKPELRQASVARIDELLNDAMRESKLAPSHWYWTGAYATMRLVAAKGHAGFVAFMNDYGQSRDVFKSFENIYGMKFEAFSKIIAPEIKALTLGLQR